MGPYSSKKINKLIMIILKILAAILLVALSICFVLFLVWAFIVLVMAIGCKDLELDIDEDMPEVLPINHNSDNQGSPKEIGWTDVI